MATVYLCIGTMKTGTSTLQWFMRGNNEVLKKQGYCYPYFPMCGKNIRHRNGHFLIYDAKYLEEPERTEKNERVKEGGYRIIAEAAEQYDNIVLSEELLWHYSRKYKNFWSDIQEKLRAINCDLKIVVYLRRQDELIQSLWNQNVKLGSTVSDTFADYIQKKLYSYFPLRYYKKLTEISDQVGKENVIVRVYEDGQYEGEQHTLLSDYLHTLGIEYTDEFEIKDEERNPGIVGNYIEMKRIINGVPEYQERDDFSYRPMTRSSGYMSSKEKYEKTSMFSSYEEQVQFMKTYQKGNSLVAKEFLGREDGILFRKPIKELQSYQVDQENMYRDMLVFMTEMFCEQEKKIERLEEMIKQQGNILPMRMYKKIKKKIKK